MRALIFALVLAGCAAPAHAQDAPNGVAAAFAPLIGCWRGSFAGATDITDERCFERIMGGRYVRDTHFVRPTPYGGETIYFFDTQANGMAFTYYASDGGMSRGAMRVAADRLVFDAHTYVGADGHTMRMRATWTIEAPDRYVAVTEREEAEGVWRPWGRITYTRAPN